MNPSIASDLERLQADQPVLREALDARRHILESAERHRQSCETQEEPIRRWEIQVREKSPSGPRWSSLLADGKELIASAGENYAAILDGEREGLDPLKRATDLLRDLLTDPDVELDPRLPEMLEQCARLREQEIRWLEEIIKLSGRIENLNGDATPDQVRSLLELRRRFLDQVKMLTDTSWSLEERAFTLRTEAAEGEGKGSAEAGPTTSRATVEEILDVEFEDLDRKLESFAEERDQALSRLVAVEAKHEEETERRKDLERRLAETKAALAAAENRVREAEAETGRVRREKDGVVAAHTATESELLVETKRRKKLEEDLHRAGEDRDQTLTDLAEAEAGTVTAQAALAEEKARRRDELRHLSETIRSFEIRSQGKSFETRAGEEE